MAVAERLSVTAAARHLGIAQPPLSVQIRNLEAEIGCALFTRRNRRLELTPAGNQLLDAATDILGRMERAVCQIQDQAAGRLGEITLGYTDAAFSDVVTRRLRKFQRKHRGVRLTLRPASHNRSNPCLTDAFITEFATDELPSTGIPLQTAQIQVALPPKHRLADRTELQASDLIGETLLLAPPEERTAAERIFLALGDRSGISIPIQAGPSRLQDRFWMISVGLGVGLCTNRDRGSLDAIRIPLGDPVPAVVTTLVPNPDSRAAALPPLIEALRE